jgi:glycosyltransferase involved in cell wall biosynthesis
MPSPAVTIVILTFNEENNLPDCLNSIRALECEILVVDSYSTDRTLAILKDHRIRLVQHEFVNYSLQRNWSQNQVRTDWVLHLDADERLSEQFIAWFNNQFPLLAESCDGFLFSRKTLFMNRWIKYGGHHPNYHLRLFKKDKAICEEKAYDQHFTGIAGGSFRTVRNIDIVNIAAKNLTSFTSQHNRWSSLEAEEIISLKSANSRLVTEKLFGTPIERIRWLKMKIFMQLPLFIRPFSYFIYRYFLRMGFLDGMPGLIFHFLHGFWFRFLVDAKVYELKQATKLSDSQTPCK